jgi:hypothetical protein
MKTDRREQLNRTGRIGQAEQGTVAQDILFSVFVTLNSSFVSKEITGQKMILLRKMYCIDKNIIFEVSSELSATTWNTKITFLNLYIYIYTVQYSRGGHIR